LDNLILRGAVLRNTEFAYAVVVYTGANTKIIKNLRPAKLKTSTLEKQLNWFVGGAFVYNAFLLISSVVMDYIGYINILELQKKRQLTDPYDYAIDWYLGPVETSSSTRLKNSILSFFAMYSYVIPISLFVTMEVVRLVQGTFMSWDNKMKSSFTMDDESVVITPMKANNTNLNEELARVDYVFSDKTGTFTKNEMRLAKWFVDDTVYDEMNDSGSLGRALKDVRVLINSTYFFECSYYG
jgi:phospholipid-transporting ATPase